MNKNPKEILAQLLKKQKFGVIATQGDSSPYTNLVSFFSSEDLKNIFFTTSRNTKKYENILKNSRISILIDNRDNSESDIKNAIVVTAIGSAFEQERHLDIHKELFLKKHPYLSDFVDSSDSALINISVDKYILVNGFENINLIEI